MKQDAAKKDPRELSKKAFELSAKAEKIKADPEASFKDKSNAHGKAMLAHGTASIAAPIGSPMSQAHYRASGAHLNRQQPEDKAEDVENNWAKWDAEHQK